MTPQEIRAIGDRHIDDWINRRGDAAITLREHVAAAIADALAIDYQRRCRTSTPPHDINNPPFIRHCAPQNAPDA